MSFTLNCKGHTLGEGPERTSRSSHNSVAKHFTSELWNDPFKSSFHKFKIPPIILCVHKHIPTRTHCQERGPQNGLRIWRKNYNEFHENPTIGFSSTRGRYNISSLALKKDHPMPSGYKRVPAEAERLQKSFRGSYAHEQHTVS